MNKAELDALIERVAHHEGFRRHPYKCPAGKLTIGYGRNLDDVGISEGEALLLLRHDLARAWLDVGLLECWSKLNTARQGVLVEMAFNMGWSGLMGFRRTLAALDADDYELAAKEMLASKWAAQVGKRAELLASIMRSGAA